jgi:hypothetical protein
MAIFNSYVSLPEGNMYLACAAPLLQAEIYWHSLAGPEVSGL